MERGGHPVTRHWDPGTAAAEELECSLSQGNRRHRRRAERPGGAGIVADAGPDCHGDYRRRTEIPAFSDEPARTDDRRNQSDRQRPEGIAGPRKSTDIMAVK